MSSIRSAAVDKRTDPEPASYVPCGVCQREIPLSAAVWREGSDYVEYFCGLECYDRWRNPSGGHR
jgi:Domain of unknown function (DUF3330)